MRESRPLLLSRGLASSPSVQEVPARLRLFSRRSISFLSLANIAFDIADAFGAAAASERRYCIRDVLYSDAKLKRRVRDAS